MSCHTPTLSTLFGHCITHSCKHVLLFLYYFENQALFRHLDLGPENLRPWECTFHTDTKLYISIHHFVFKVLHTQCYVTFSLPMRICDIFVFKVSSNCRSSVFGDWRVCVYVWCPVMCPSPCYLGCTC